LSETAPTPLALANTEADYKAAYLSNPRPPYPFAAVRQGAEGRVLLSAEVLPDGRAGRVRLEKSSGHNLLDAAALNTVRSWRFTPARKGGVATAQTVSIPIDFNLQDRR
jgi:protein TonB